MKYLKLFALLSVIGLAMPAFAQDALLLKLGRWKVRDADDAKLKFKSVKLEKGDHGSVSVTWPSGESGSLTPTVLNNANYVYNSAGYRCFYEIRRAEGSNIYWDFKTSDGGGGESCPKSLLLQYDP